MNPTGHRDGMPPTEPPAGDGTRVIHAGLAPAVTGQPLLAGPVFAAPYHLGAEPPGAYFYGRNDNPTLAAFESALAELEGGPALVLPSGMAATSTVLLALLRSGDRVVVPSDGYYNTRLLAAEDLTAFGIKVDTVATTEIGRFAEDGGLDGVALLLLETPSNPGMDVCDIAAISTAAHRAGGLVAVDNTTATPLGQRPLELGADISFASDTKALSGHSDLLLGHVAARDPAVAARLRTWRTRSGAVPGPFEVWLAHRSLGTLDLRLARQATNALAVAGALRHHPAVQALRYPGLPDDPAFALAARQQRRLGGVLSFDLGDAQAAADFAAASRLAVNATSFGGLHTTVDRRAQWSADDVSEGFVRLSCGCEDTADLVADLVRAADSLRSGA